MADISSGVKLFNESYYFEAHDFFEQLWNDSEDKDKIFFQGLIQISVGSYHLLNKNTTGALSQYKKGYKKLEKFSSGYFGLDIENLLKQVNRLILILESDKKKPYSDEKFELPVLGYLNNFKNK